MTQQDIETMFAFLRRADLPLVLQEVQRYPPELHAMVRQVHADAIAQIVHDVLEAFAPDCHDD